MKQGLKELSELVSSYQGLRENEARGPSIVSAAIACARRCNLDKDIKDLPPDDFEPKQMTLDVREKRNRLTRSSYCAGDYTVLGRVC